MRSFIQLTNTDNEILRSLPLGDLSSTIIYSFRVWNNLQQAVGIASLDGLELNLMYPPKQGIKTLVNNDTIKVRCIYSGERSQLVTSNFQNFPITHSNYDRLEPYTYNEYEIQIDFSNLSIKQKDTVDLIDMEFNIVVTYDNVFFPYEKPKLLRIGSGTSIRGLVTAEILLLSDTLIDTLLELVLLSDSRIKRLEFNVTDKISHTKIRTPFFVDTLSDSRVLVITLTDVMTDTRIVETLGSEISVNSDGWIKIIPLDDIANIEIEAVTRIKNTYQEDRTSDVRVKVLGVNADRLAIESNTLIV